MASLVVNVPVAVPPGMPKPPNITSTNWKTWSAAASRLPRVRASTTADRPRIDFVFIGPSPGLAGPAGAGPPGRPRWRIGAGAADAGPDDPTIRLGMGPYSIMKAGVTATIGT